MSNLMKKEDREIKPGKTEKKVSGRIHDIRSKISDEKYLDHAILRIATDLSHYLTK